MLPHDSRAGPHHGVIGRVQEVAQIETLRAGLTPDDAPLYVKK